MSNTLPIKFAVAMVLVLGLTACGENAPSEKSSGAGKSAGQAVGNAARATGDAVGDAAKATGDAVGDAAEATGTAVGDAARATGEYLSPSKEAAIKAARDTLDGIEKKWQELQAKAAPVTDEAKADFQKAKKEMTQALADAKAKLVEAKDASPDVWQRDVKPALDAAVQKAQKLYGDTAARFGGKQAG